MNDQKTIILNNDVKMPALGLGVFLADGNETQNAVEIALANDYRLIDTASIYENELEVGRGIKANGIDRKELFVTTKLWITDYGYDETLKAFDQSLQKLGLDYLDLYLLHWPTPSNFEKTIESWRAMESLYEQGLIKAIGVCNFNKNHLEELISRTQIKPVLNQVELHPYFSQQEINKVDTELGIVTQAWSPIGGALNYHPADRQLPHILQHKIIRDIAETHHKSAAQAIIKWHLQHGRSLIPKSVQENRIIENFSVFDFTLSEHEMRIIDSLNVDMRVGYKPEEYDLAYYNKTK